MQNNVNNIKKRKYKRTMLEIKLAKNDRTFSHLCEEQTNIKK